ncbi:hypothetical protein D477_018384 [Arthrobacter crystallopoietes BAB-32]|uniref:Activator of Hsp90 ATPase homologue 1/2-like C-terminal domain-containing protein n=1 Tax=Arthrobacter crystallopoietes BAB-32 TaxID=1246476 RepID=N1V3I8_9MICC|nr:SRPBCC family protein [Arthrobacter crystallopoietes]EMY32778.1 hypothetical protein D477_018384 [Arthrobacter crystallopoietes BAB-32]
MEITSELNDIKRAVHQIKRDGLEGIGLLLQRSYLAELQDVWQALTEPEQLRRWFLPVSGELGPGGSFQLEGNAGGSILKCEAPNLLRVTFGGPTSVVEVRLAEDAGQTALEFEHNVDLETAGSGAGALFVGPGWDVALVALGLFLAGRMTMDPSEWENTPEVREAAKVSIDAWAKAAETSGTATADQIEQGVAVATAQFTEDPAADQG